MLRWGKKLIGGFLLELGEIARDAVSSLYTILLQLTDVVGLQKNADVLMSGVKVGSVSAITLVPGGKSVTISLRIYREFVVHKDATFRLEQSGFLGDQYVAIQPNENKKMPFADMDEATADPAFSIQAAARTAIGFVERLDHSLSKLDVHSSRCDG